MNWVVLNINRDVPIHLYRKNVLRLCRAVVLKIIVDYYLTYHEPVPLAKLKNSIGIGVVKHVNRSIVSGDLKKIVKNRRVFLVPSDYTIGVYKDKSYKDTYTLSIKVKKVIYPKDKFDWWINGYFIADVIM